MGIDVRHARDTDLKAVIDVVQEAFAPSKFEAALVALLWKHEKISAHYVAVQTGTVVGYAAFSLASSDTGAPIGFHLAPLAVAPKFQRKGVGSALIKFSIEDLGTSVPLFVLGDPEYYATFGFIVDPELHSSFDESGGHFQVLERGGLERGEVFYEPEFLQAIEETAARAPSA